MMSLSEERQLAEKMRQQGAMAGVAIGYPMENLHAPDVAQERAISEEEWGFTASLADLITRARWGVETRRIAHILYEQAAALETEVQRAGAGK